MDDGWNPDSYISRLFQIESNGNPNATTGSNRGLGQFGPAEEARYGINDANRTSYDAQAAAVMREANEHRGVLSRALGRDPSPGELYLTHQQGIAGGPALLTADPSTPAWQVLRPFYRSDAIARKAITGNIPGNEALSGLPADQITAGDFRNMWVNRFERGHGGAMSFAPESGAPQDPGLTAIQSALKQRNGNAMADNDSPVLFGGNPTPVGALGALARMIGIGSEPDLGRRLQNAGASLIAVGLPESFGSARGAASMMEAANKQNWSPIADPYGNQFLVDHRTGAVRPMFGGGGATPGAPGAAPGGAQNMEQLQENLANTPAGLKKQLELNAEQTAKTKASLEDSANEARNLRGVAERMIELSQDPRVVQGPGIGNMVRLELAKHSGGALGNVDLNKQGEFEQLQNQLAAQMGKPLLNGARVAGPEINFLKLMKPGSGYTSEANQTALKHIVDMATGIEKTAEISRGHNNLGPKFRAEVEQYYKDHPPYQGEPAQKPMQNGAPKVGESRRGYTFKGGNPADPKSWEKE